MNLGVNPKVLEQSFIYHMITAIQLSLMKKLLTTMCSILGVAAWKANFDTRYVLVDQSSLKNWRGFMAESIQEKGMDVAAFMSVLDTASSESAQRAEIPTGGVTQTMANAQQVRTFEA